MMEAPAVTDQRRGAIGVDLNADHLAVAETDSSGNYVNAWRVPLVSSSLASSERWICSAMFSGSLSTPIGSEGSCTDNASAASKSPALCQSVPVSFAGQPAICSR